MVGQAWYWWFSPAEAGCQATSPCHATPPANLPDGTAEWQVQSWTANGSSNWSDPLLLTVGVDQATGARTCSPSGTRQRIDPVHVERVGARDAVLHPRD